MSCFNVSSYHVYMILSVEGTNTLWSNEVQNVEWMILGCSVAGYNAVWPCNGNLPLRIQGWSEENWDIWVDENAVA
jgi:hypothetical protein